MSSHKIKGVLMTKKQALEKLRHEIFENRKIRRIDKIKKAFVEYEKSNSWWKRLKGGFKEC